MLVDPRRGVAHLLLVAVVVADELADVLTYCYLLADRIGVDPDQIVLDKLERTGAKYPVDKSRGRSDKYDQL